MSRYIKYSLQSILDLKDGFCRYFVQDRSWGVYEILDVEALVYDQEEDAEAMLWECIAWDPSFTVSRLRYFLAEDCRVHFVFKMDDHRVVRETARQLVQWSYRVVLEPGPGWAVKVDGDGRGALLPVGVEPEPELEGLLAEIQQTLDSLVAGQRKKYDEYEAMLAGLNDAQKAALYSRKAGGGVWDATLGGVIDMVQAAPGAIVKMARAFPGFYKGYLKTLQKIALMPGRMAALTAESVLTGTTSPLEKEIDRIVDPIAGNYEEAMRYKSMLQVLFADEQTMEMLQDFAARYWEATHPLERTELGAGAAADIVVTVILAIFTAGVGAAANVAAKSTRLAKVARLLERLARILKRIGPRHRLIKKEIPGSGATAGTAKTSRKAAKAGMPEPGRPKAKAGKGIDKKRENKYITDNDIDGPKKTSDRSIPAKYANRKDVTHRSADEVNAEFSPGWKPPYKKGTRVTEYTNIEPEQFSRVHLGEDARGQWMMRSEAIKGLSPEEIVKKYSLPDVPKYVSDVNVPAGTRIRTGKVASSFGGHQGATQYQLLGRIPDSSFGNTKPLR